MNISRRSPPPNSPRPLQEGFTVLLAGGMYILTRSQIRFDAPNYFTKEIDKDPSQRVFHIDRDENCFIYIWYYCARHTLVGPEAPAPLHLNIIDALIEDAQFFQMSKLETFAKKWKREQLDGADLPAYPMEHAPGGWAFFELELLRFSEAVTREKVEGKDLNALIMEKHIEESYKLFQFDDLILSINALPFNQISMSITFRSQAIRKYLKKLQKVTLPFVHADKTHATLKLPSYTYRQGKVATVQSIQWAIC
ncbi:hypothetical protein T439DRAFT_360088 [Meredithblackwellia eburnea MCA 4105]